MSTVMDTQGNIRQVVKIAVFDAANRPSFGTAVTRKHLAFKQRLCNIVYHDALHLSAGGSALTAYRIPTAFSFTLPHSHSECNIEKLPPYDMILAKQTRLISKNCFRKILSVLRQEQFGEFILFLVQALLISTTESKCSACQNHSSVFCRIARIPLRPGMLHISETPVHFPY